jgi:putative Mn2+ efflux pump MntP
VAAASGRERWRLGLLMPASEMAMPITGLLFLRDDPRAEGSELARRLRGRAATGVGLSVSLDELAIGFVTGLLRLPRLVVALLVGAQSPLASQLGPRLGGRLGERLGERAEQAAGVLLLALGVALAASRAGGHSV